MSPVHCRQEGAAVNAITADSEISCPVCGWRQWEIMPEDACQIVYHCASCGVALHPKPGDCCVYCSFGSVPCPPVQRERRFGSAPDYETTGRG